MENLIPSPQKKRRNRQRHVNQTDAQVKVVSGKFELGDRLALLSSQEKINKEKQTFGRLKKNTKNNETRWRKRKGKR